jgi:DNA gyrase subunit A
VDKDEKVRAILPVKDMECGKSIVFATAKGRVKKTTLDSYQNVLSRGIIAIRLVDDDDLVRVRLVDQGQHILMASKNGQSIRFKESDTRPMGRSTQGVLGMRLAGDDKVIGMEVLDDGAAILTVSSNGYGKRTATEEYRVQSRGGKGIITIKTGGRNGHVVGIRQVTGDEDLLLVTADGQLIRMDVEQISLVGRNTLGVTLFRVQKGAEVVAIECLPKEEEEDVLYDEDGNVVDEEGNIIEVDDAEGEGSEANAEDASADEESSVEPPEESSDEEE